MFENMELLNIIILSTVAGLFSSVLGGIIAIIISKDSKKFIGLSFMFASSVLIALVFIDFIPHAIGNGHYHLTECGLYRYWYQHDGAGIVLTLIGIAIGVLLIFLLSFFDNYGHEHIHGFFSHDEHCSHDSVDKKGLTKTEKKRMIAMAFPIALAIILHDFPKGLAIGSAGSIMAAIAIGISCIPEGMSIAIPLKAGGMKKSKILLICSIAGLATVLGAIIGYFVGGINAYLSGIMFAVASGCILGVVFSEMLPIAFEYSKLSKWKFLVMPLGVLLVIIIHYLFH